MESGVVFSCGNCSKIFAKRRDYNRHRKSHERPHKCSICDRTFGLKTDRDKHRITHSAIRPPKFMCTFPDCRFKGASHKKYLLKHMQTSHVDAKDPNSQKAIRLHYQNAPNSTVSQAEEIFLHLLGAINQGNESYVKEFLSSNANFLTIGRRGPTAGNLAVQKGNLYILNMIFEAGVDVNSNQLDPWLHQTLRKGQFTTAKFLIESGADVSEVHKMTFLLKSSLLKGELDGVSAGDLATSLGVLDLLKIVVAAGIDVNINTSDPWLHQALRNHHFTTAEFLIKSGANIDAKSSEKQTAFEAAVLRGCEVSISLLHRSGAEIRPGRSWRSRVQSLQHVPSDRLRFLVCLKAGQVLNGDKYPDWNGSYSSLKHESSTYPYILAIPFFKDIIRPGDTPLIELLLDFEDGSCSPSKPKVEALVGFEPLASIHDVPRSREEPATTLLSTIKYDDKWIIKLLLEERTDPRGRYLWEQVVYRDFSQGGTSKARVVRLLREWGPIATVAS